MNALEIPPSLSLVRFKQDFALIFVSSQPLCRRSMKRTKILTGVVNGGRHTVDGGPHVGIRVSNDSLK